VEVAVLTCRFIRNEKDNDDSVWQKRFAKDYYDKLFKNYCLANFSRYKEGKVGMRWRTEDEVISGKGQFVCGAEDCSETKSLKSYEVPFAYVETGQKKHALVKLRVCPACATQLGATTMHRNKQEKHQLQPNKSLVKGTKRQRSPEHKSEDDSESSADTDAPRNVRRKISLETHNQIKTDDNKNNHHKNNSTKSNSTKNNNETNKTRTQQLLDDLLH